MKSINPTFSPRHTILSDSYYLPPIPIIRRPKPSTDSAINILRAKYIAEGFSGTMTQDAVVATDHHGIILWANHHFTDMSSYTERDIVGKPLTIFIDDTADDNNNDTEDKNIRECIENAHQTHIISSTILFQCKPAILLTKEHKTIPVTIALAQKRETLNQYFIAQITPQYRKASLIQMPGEPIHQNTLPALVHSDSRFTRYYPSVTVLFCDIHHSTMLDEEAPTSNLHQIFNEVFSKRTAELCRKYDILLIKTIGDSYMTGCGFDGEVDHANRIAAFSYDIYHVLYHFNRIHNTNFQIRIGINSGEVQGRFFSLPRKQFNVWGKEVCLASDLKSLCTPGEIHISQPTYNRLSERFSMLFSCKEPVDLNDTSSQMMTYCSAGNILLSSLPSIPRNNEGIARPRATISFKAREDTPQDLRLHSYRTKLTPLNFSRTKK